MKCAAEIIFRDSMRVRVIEAVLAEMEQSDENHLQLPD